MLTRFLLIFISISYCSVFAEQPSAVITRNTLNCEISENHICTYRIEREVLVNSKQGQEYSIHRIYFVNKKELKKVTIAIYDNKWKLIRKIDPDAMFRHSVFSYSLFEDHQVAEVNVSNDTYPYFLNIQYEIRQKEYLALPVWEPQPFEKIATTYSSYTLTTPADFRFNHRFYNCRPVEDSTQIKDNIVYKWELRDLNPVITEDCYRSPAVRVPYALFIPKTFFYANKTGQSDGWNSLGKWVSDIKQGLDELPAEEVNKVLEMVKNKNTDIEKIRVLYKYMQTNDRYVSVQMGSGGYIPYSARFVSENKFGDAKALSNYMHALLAVAGIPSFLVMVRAGEFEARLDTSFVFPCFNHVILCVPLKKDSVWLECTSPITPPGFLGTFTAGKQVLLLNGDYSVLRKTPTYTINQNYIHTKRQVDIHKDQTWSISVSKQYAGFESEQIRNKTKTLSAENLQKWFINSQPYQDIKIKSIHYECTDSFPSVTGKVRFDCTRKTGKSSVYATMNKFPNSCIISKQNRTEDINIPNSYEFSDTTSFAFPSEYTIVALPSSKEVATRFGKYTRKVSQLNNMVMIVRTLSKNSGNYSKELIPEFNDFNSGINQLENEEILYSSNE